MEEIRQNAERRN